jgi:hypothetical protein
MKKFISVVAIFWLLAALLVAQSLVEASKKEQERREQYKGKNVRIVTNDDLKAAGKKPAVAETPSEPAKPGAGAPGQTQTADEAQAEGQRPLLEREPDAGPVNLPYADSIVESSLVTSPEYALGGPDRNFAEIDVAGILTLDFTAKNGPGDDIAIYAKPINKPGETPEGGDEAIWTEYMTYGVLVAGDSGEWEAIGRGSGVISPEKFDLGTIPSIKRIQIVFFQPQANPYLPIRPLKTYGGDYVIGIDAVEALH